MVCWTGNRKRTLVNNSSLCHRFSVLELGVKPIDERKDLKQVLREKVIKLVSCAPALKRLYKSQICLWGSAGAGQVTVLSHCFHDWSPSRRQLNDFLYFSFCVSVNFHYWTTLKGRGYLSRTLASQFNFALRAFSKTSLRFFFNPPRSENRKEVSHYLGNCNIFISFTWNSSCYSVSLNWGTAGGSYWRAFALKCTWKPSLIGSHLIWLWYGTSSRAWAAPTIV